MAGLDLPTLISRLQMDPGWNSGGLGTGPQMLGGQIFPGHPAAQEFDYREVGPQGTDLVAGAGMPLALMSTKFKNWIPVYKGVSRGKIEPNDMGNIFLTTDKTIAENYTEFISGKYKGMQQAYINPKANIADMSNKKTVQSIVEELPNVNYSYWKNIDTDKKWKNNLIKELVTKGNEGHGDIMDDWSIARAISNLGFDGIKSKDIYVLNNPDMIKGIKDIKR